MEYSGTKSTHTQGYVQDEHITPPKEAFRRQLDNDLGFQGQEHHEIEQPASSNEYFEYETFQARKAVPEQRDTQPQFNDFNPSPQIEARDDVGQTEIEAPTSEDQFLIKEKSPKKKLLFQVDINLDNKVVRIGIHEGDDVDETVDRFSKLFNLKPKQDRLLRKRLKRQLDSLERAVTY